jgi:hypothetical protein
VELTTSTTDSRKNAKTFLSPSFSLSLHLWIELNWKEESEKNYLENVLENFFVHSQLTRERKVQERKSEKVKEVASHLWVLHKLFSMKIHLNLHPQWLSSLSFTVSRGKTERICHQKKKISFFRKHTFDARKSDEKLNLSGIRKNNGLSLDLSLKFSSISLHTHKTFSSFFHRQSCHHHHRFAL